MVAMPRDVPRRLTVRTYDVGFGDCFLLTFHYRARDRHVLIDFGSMRLPTGKSVKGEYLVKIAEAIKADCGGKLDAVIATHRHQDHISGFARRNGKGPGEIIRALKPTVVIQPWTEDPKAAKDATAPTRQSFAKMLLDMHDVADQVVAASRRLNGEAFAAVRAQLGAIGMDNIANPDAVANLQTMARNRFVHHGANAGLGRILPGVTVTVLGPPTVAQDDKIMRQRSTDPDEFWHLTGRFWGQLALTKRAHVATAKSLFPGHPTGKLPRAAGWFRYAALREQADTLLSIVRMLDKAMNNTSVILLFEVNGKLILFPGDAQYENWMYALSKSEIRKTLAGVNLYKVGHHGSLNATPKTLWNGFTRRSGSRKPGRLQTLLSTKEGVHGSPDRKTEVPRRPLLRALRENSDLMSTEDFAADVLREPVTIDL
jgi:beta-lactamase superfamily II metal-dependent hydrolase